MVYAAYTCMHRQLHQLHQSHNQISCKRRVERPHQPSSAIRSYRSEGGLVGVKFANACTSAFLQLCCMGQAPAVIKSQSALET
jgi:hypothetical protein